MPFVELGGEDVEEGPMGRRSSECVEEEPEEDRARPYFAGDELVEKEAREAVTKNGEGFLKEVRSEDAEADIAETTPPTC